MGNNYDYDFYATRDRDTKYAANRILGIIKEYIDIASAVDVGGGVGTWLKAIQEESGCTREDILLFEGDYVQRNLLQIGEESYIPCDLQERITANRRYDIAISLEVAEHLSRDRADSFCEDLTRLSDVVLFAAAVPLQGGVGHINEQPLSYWTGLFSKYDYEPYDIIRPRIQQDRNIRFWYRQNAVVFVKKGCAAHRRMEDKAGYLPPLDMVSYDLYLSKAEFCGKVQSLWVYKVYRFLKKAVKRE